MRKKYKRRFTYNCIMNNTVKFFDLFNKQDYDYLLSIMNSEYCCSNYAMLYHCINDYFKNKYGFVNFIDSVQIIVDDKNREIDYNLYVQNTYYLIFHKMMQKILSN